MTNINHYKILLAACLLTAVTYTQAEEPETIQPAGEQLEEILVTAERRVTNLQETPIAVTAITEQDLERLLIKRTEDIDYSVPGLRIDSNIASSNALTVVMRGTNEQNSAFNFTEPAVGLYMNGVYRRLSAGAIELADIERIEVLRGPQGTLFGRNTLAGAINIITRTPGQDPYGKVSFSYDTFETSYFKGVIGGGITDRLSGSLSAIYKDRAEGPFNNQYDGKDIGEETFKGLQGTLNWEPTDDVQLILMGYYNDNENDGALGSPRYASTGEYIFKTPDVVAAPSPNIGLLPYSEARESGVDLTLNWQIRDQLTLKSISSYIDTETRWGIDFTAGQAGTGCTGMDCYSGFFRVSDGDQNQFSEEIQLLGTGEKLDWIIGLYYFTEETNQLIQDDIPLFYGLQVPQVTTLESDSIAIYGQLNYAISEKWGVTVGGRYTRDEKKFYGNKAGSNFAPTDFYTNPDWDNFSGKLSLDYHPNDNTMLYASFSQGFKSGAFDPFGNADFIVNPLEPEYVDSYELGYKGTLLNNTLRLNAALYRAEYKDLVVGGVNAAAGLRNANGGEAAVQGIELETTWLATDRLRFYLSGTYLFDHEWDKTGTTGPFETRVGDELPLVSELEWTLTASYEWALGDLGSLTLNLTAHYDDGYYPNAAHLQQPIELIPERHVYNAGLSFSSANGHHEVWLNGRNITDTQKYYSLANFYVFLYNDTSMMYGIEPASWELGYRYSF